MESQEALERSETVVQGHEESHVGGWRLARAAAIVVAVLAAYLAAAAYLGNQATTTVITDETNGADSKAQFDVNDIKTIVARASAVLLPRRRHRQPEGSHRVTRQRTLRGACKRS